PGVVDVELTAEQLGAVERRRGDLLLDAGAGSGKTSVLVERFVRAVIEDDVDVGAILTITFTEKAAAEMRDRIRTRFRELGAAQCCRRTPSCARVGMWRRGCRLWRQPRTSRQREANWSTPLQSPSPSCVRSPIPGCA